MPTLTDNFNSKLSVLKRKFKIVLNNQHFKYGLPVITLVIGGSFGLRYWTSIRYQFTRNKGLTAAEAEKMGLKREKKVTLEEAYEDIKKLDIDNWENIRGPRAWEEPQKR